MCVDDRSRKAHEATKKLAGVDEDRLFLMEVCFDGVGLSTRLI